MKVISRILALTSTVFCFPISTPAEVIFQNDFSGGGLGWSRTSSTDSAFSSAWSITASWQTELGNRFALFNIDIPVLPTYPGSRWSGGYYTQVSQEKLALPEQWQLSFDLSLPVAEPVQVGFRFAPKETFPSPWPLPSVALMTFWIEPAAAGWQHIVVDQNTPYKLSETFSSSGGTSLTVMLASHDAAGNPLSIAQIGTHSFSLDNVILQTVPEPAGITCLGLAVLGGMHARKRFRHPRSAP